MTEPVAPLPETDATRREILAAARDRFQRYGYRKTTMAEIADDVGMSAANLYRYFDNKQAIAAACAVECLGERLALLEQVVAGGGSAADRLRQFALTLLRYTHEEFSRQPHVHELVEFIVAERRDVVDWKVQAECGLLERLLAEGTAGGEFREVDRKETACAIHAALAMFQLPLFMTVYPVEELEARARSVVDLLLHGLVPPRDQD